MAVSSAATATPARTIEAVPPPMPGASPPRPAPDPSPYAIATPPTAPANAAGGNKPRPPRADDRAVPGPGPSAGPGQTVPGQAVPGLAVPGQAGPSPLSLARWRCGAGAGRPGRAARARARPPPARGRPPSPGPLGDAGCHRAQQVDDPRAPSGGDVVVQRDHVAQLHRGQPRPARALGHDGRVLLAAHGVGQEGRQAATGRPHDHPPSGRGARSAPAATPGGIGTNRPSAEDRSLARVRRPGSSPWGDEHGAASTASRTPGGITVAGQRRIRTGFAGLCAIPGQPRTPVPYRSQGRGRKEGRTCRPGVPTQGG